MEVKCRPCCLICLDESMVVFLNPHAPEQVHVKRKKYPMGNKYHTATCTDTKIIYFVEMVEGRDKTEKGQDLKKQFEGEMDSNVVVLVARICFCICGLGQVVVLDLGFGYVSTLVELWKLGLFSTYVIKKKNGWPKDTRTEEVLSEIHGKDIGTIIVRKAKSVDD